MRAGDEAHDGPAPELVGSAGHHLRHLDRASRHRLAHHVDRLEVLARVREDRLELVQRPCGQGYVLRGHHGTPVEADLRDGVDEAGGVGDVRLGARAQLAGVRIENAHAAPVVAEVAGGPVEDDVAAGVAGGEERRLRRRLQRRPHDRLGQARDLRRAVDAAAAAFQRVERALKREAHSDLGECLEDARLQPLHVGRAQHVPAQARPDRIDTQGCVRHRSSSSPRLMLPGGRGPRHPPPGRATASMISRIRRPPTYANGAARRSAPRRPGSCSRPSGRSLTGSRRPEAAASRRRDLARGGSRGGPCPGSCLR